MNLTPRKIKQDLLAECENQHRTRFSRVGASAVETIEARLEASYRSILRAFVQSHPSKGKTLL